MPSRSWTFSLRRARLTLYCDALEVRVVPAQPHAPVVADNAAGEGETQRHESKHKEIGKSDSTDRDSGKPQSEHKESGKPEAADKGTGKPQPENLESVKSEAKDKANGKRESKHNESGKPDPEDKGRNRDEITEKESRKPHSEVNGPGKSQSEHKDNGKPESNGRGNEGRRNEGRGPGDGKTPAEAQAETEQTLAAIAESVGQAGGTPQQDVAAAQSLLSVTRQTVPAQSAAEGPLSPTNDLLPSPEETDLLQPDQSQRMNLQVFSLPIGAATVASLSQQQQLAISSQPPVAPVPSLVDDDRAGGTVAEGTGAPGSEANRMSDPVEESRGDSREAEPPVDVRQEVPDVRRDEEPVPPPPPRSNDDFSPLPSDEENFVPPTPAPQSRPIRTFPPLPAEETRDASGRPDPGLELVMAPVEVARVLVEAVFAL